MGLGVMGLMGWWMRPHSAGEKDWRMWSICGFLGIWLAAKIAFVELVIPTRTAHHNAEPIAATLRELVPPSRTLYLFRMKDEGVMFYYARPVIRLNKLAELPSGEFAVLIHQEWDEWAVSGSLEQVTVLHDQQGDPFILVRALK